MMASGTIASKNPGFLLCMKSSATVELTDVIVRKKDRDLGQDGVRIKILPEILYKYFIIIICIIIELVKIHLGSIDSHGESPIIDDTCVFV